MLYIYFDYSSLHRLRQAILVSYMVNGGQKTLSAHPEVAVIVGSFEDDVKITQEKDRLCPPVKLLAAVGAGVNEFRRQVGPLSEGVIGPSQWEPESECSPEAGPDSQWFVAHFRREFNILPNYTAAQSFAAGIIVEKCIERSGDVSDVELRQVVGHWTFKPFTGDSGLIHEQANRLVIRCSWSSGKRERNALSGPWRQQNAVCGSPCTEVPFHPPESSSGLLFQIDQLKTSGLDFTPNDFNGPLRKDQLPCVQTFPLLSF